MENEEDKEKKEEESSGEDGEKKESEKVSEGELEEEKDKEDASETSDIINDDELERENSEEIAEDREGKEIIDEETEKVSEENKQLKKVFAVIGILAVFFIGVFLFINSVRQFTYEGIDFNVVKEGELILYQTSLPVNSEHKVTGGAVFADYNFYLRNDPRKLKNLPFEVEELTLMRNVALNFTGDFKCGGVGIIAVANIMNVLEVLDVTAIKDEVAKCDYGGAYTFLQLQVANESSIEQFGPSCYNLNINNCEVLEVTEKYIVELLAEIHKNQL